jgi:hypothetical protein
VSLSDEDLSQIILNWLKKTENVVHNPHSFIAFEAPKLGNDVNRDQVFDVFHKLFVENVIREAEENMQNYYITEYGNTVLGDTSEFIFLEPQNYLKKIHDNVPNVDAITLSYIDESLFAYKNSLFLSATTMIGCASENAILTLIESFITYVNDPGIEKRFDDAWSIKTKYELLKSLYINMRVKRRVARDMRDRGKALSENQKHYFAEFETITDNLFHIYRMNRNDAGHPTGKEMDKDILKVNLTSFQRYLESIYGIKNVFDILAS